MGGDEAVTSLWLPVTRLARSGQAANLNSPGLSFAPRIMMERGMARQIQADVSEAEEGLLTGQLLIAMPGMEGTHFNQAVIYLCAHSAEGAMGIVLNRPLTSPTFDDLLRQLGVVPVPPIRMIDLYQGGPVDSGRGFVLHTSDWTGDGSLVVDPQVALTASLDVLKAFADGGGPEHGLLALGYAGWGPGQLDQEMQENAWLSAPASLNFLFDREHETKWRRAMAILKVDPALLSASAGHA